MCFLVTALSLSLKDVSLAKCETALPWSLRMHSGNVREINEIKSPAATRYAHALMC